jgi:hypothetical protein
MKNKRRFAGCVVLFAFGLAVWLLKPCLFLPRGTSIVSWWHADAMNQCSLEPISRANYWVPTADQIVDFEVKMAGVMWDREKSRLMVPPPGQRFFGQYIGFTRSGVRLIYGNFVPDDMVNEQRWTFEWSPFEKPICVADGGRHFWGIVYNPNKKEIEQPTFNGPG